MVVVLLVFVGIPAAMFVVITLLVLLLTPARMPDGLARAAKSAVGAEGDERDLPAHQPVSVERWQESEDP